MTSQDEWDVEFWEDEDGTEPFQKFLDDLPELKRLAMVAAIERVLAREGPDVCKSEWGEHVGDGTLEFRVRHSADEIRQMFPKQTDAAAPLAAPAEKKRKRKKGRGEMVLRAFFTVEGNKLILMTGGYDKGENPSPSRQRREIETNKRRVALIKRAAAVAKKASKQAAERAKKAARSEAKKNRKRR